MQTDYMKLLKKWAEELFPLNRSLTGKGNRQTIKYIKENINSRFILKKAIKVGGTTIKNHVQPDGKLGYFSQKLKNDQEAIGVYNFANSKWYRISNVQQRARRPRAVQQRDYPNSPSVSLPSPPSVAKPELEKDFRSKNQNCTLKNVKVS